MSTEPTPEERIINAAVECIEKEGIDRATVRKIAKIAGVNNAAINYYFRTKDAMLERVMAASTENAFGDWERAIDDTTRPFVDRVRPILLEAVEGVVRFPNLVRAHLQGPVMQGDSETVFALRYRAFMTRVREALLGEHPSERAGELEVKIVGLFAATFGMAVLSGLFADLPEARLSTPEGRAAYVDLVIDRFLGGAS